uniref:Testis-expressed sequence 264 protein n=1 Tax=Micrurus corallinus TaxID=54390 RepID=A0A2D4GYT5_MICCO
MSDWLLIGLFVALVLLLLLTIFGFAVYSGLFTEVIVNAGLPPIGNITVAYKFQVGPYGDSGRFFTESCSVSPRLSSIAIYYDNPHTVDPEKCRYAVGSVLSEGEDKPSEAAIRMFLKYGFKIINFPAPSHVVTATFPYTTPLSIHLAVNRVHSSLDVYIKDRKLCAHPRLEIYKGNKIYFICPLARQGDFYVPEMKELEKKNRAAAAAVETDDDQTDITGADTMSETSSVSLETITEISETSVATSILSPFASGHSRDEADNRSEHSYSESGASGSSFEELDMEGNGDGMAGLSCDLGSAEDRDPTQVKWTKEPLAPEEKRGEE